MTDLLWGARRCLACSLPIDHLPVGVVRHPECVQRPCEICGLPLAWEAALDAKYHPGRCFQIGKERWRKRQPALAHV